MSDIIIDNDSGKFKAGDGQDLNLYHNGTNSFVENETGILYVTNKANTSLILGTNNTTAFTIDNSQNVTFAGNITQSKAGNLRHTMTATGDGEASLVLTANNTTGDSFVRWETNANTFCLGLDNSDSNKFILSAGSDPHSNSVINIQPDGSAIAVDKPISFGGVVQLLDVAQSIDFIQSGAINIDSNNDQTGRVLTIGTNRTGDSGGTTIATFTDTGFLGIGASPNALLDISKSTTDANAPTADESYEGYRLIIANPQLTNNATNALGFSMYNGEVCASIDAQTYYNGNYETTLRFQTRKDGSGGLSSKLTISPDGETVVRTERGGTGFQIINDHSSTPYGMKIDFDSATPNNTTQYYITCQDSTNDKFIVLSNGNVQSRTDSYGGISDERLKDNIVNATSKLDDLNKVRIVNYNFKDEPDEKQLGVVAQELQKIFPKMVYDYGEEKHLAVKYSIFVPMLIKAVQELSAEVEKLKNA